MPVTEQSRRLALDHVETDRAVILAEQDTHAQWERLLILRTGHYLQVRLVSPDRFGKLTRDTLPGATLIVDELSPQSQALVAGNIPDPAKLIHLTLPDPSPTQRSARLQRGPLPDDVHVVDLQMALSA